MWCILCTITMQNALCVQCAGTWCMLINRENPSTGWQASLTPALSTNQVAIPALSCTTVWQHQPMQWCYQPLYTILAIGPSFNFSNQSGNVKKEQWQSWSLLLYFSSEFNENSRSWDSSWKSAWFFLARPWEMIIFFSISPRNTRKKQKKLSFSFRSRRLKGKSSRSRKMRFLFKRKEVVWC